MRIGEIAERAGVTPKAVRYYESLGLLGSRRLANGYRDYDDDDVRLVLEVRKLSSLGITADQSRPFLDCIVAGSDAGDDCPASIATYQDTIDRLDDRIAELAARREALLGLVKDARDRSEPLCELAPTGPVQTPAGSRTPTADRQAAPATAHKAPATAHKAPATAHKEGELR